MKTAFSEFAASPAVLELSSLLGTENLFEWIEHQADDLAQLGRTTEGAVEIGRRIRDACGVETIEPGLDFGTSRIESETGTLRH